MNRITLYIIAEAFLLGGLIGALVTLQTVKPVVAGYSYGVWHRDTVYAASQPVHDTIHLAGKKITVYDTVTGLTLLRNRYSYPFDKTYDDGLKLNGSVTVDSFPLIPANLINIAISHTLPPQKTITASKTDTLKIVQHGLMGLVAGIGAGMDYQKKPTIIVGLTYGWRLF